MSEITAIITASTALLAVIIGPIVSIYVARKQIYASVVSTNRKTRFNHLQDALAEWLTAEQIFFISKHSDFWEKADAQRALEKMMLLEYRIRLLIDHTEESHLKLVELLRKEFDDLNKSLESPPQEQEELKKYGDDGIILLAQMVLKEERDRAK